MFLNFTRENIQLFIDKIPSRVWNETVFTLKFCKKNGKLAILLRKLSTKQQRNEKLNSPELQLHNSKSRKRKLFNSPQQVYFPTNKSSMEKQNSKSFQWSRQNKFKSVNDSP